jgi:hypothetical protein
VSTNVLSAARDVEVSTLPPGEYRGVWGGYEVRVEIAGVQYLLKTEHGIRTIAAPCIVRIQNGSVTVETTQS